jgi:hypothetical protein
MTPIFIQGRRIRTKMTLHFKEQATRSSPSRPPWHAERIAIEQLYAMKTKN